MDPNDLRKLLTKVSTAETSVDEAIASLENLPFSNLGFAHIDHHRALRTGFPEVIFGQGKTYEQMVAIIREIASNGQPVLATRVPADIAENICDKFSLAKYHSLSKILIVRSTPPSVVSHKSICIVCAGTSDLPVAEEAAMVAEFYGNNVECISDVGVAGLHRLLSYRSVLEKASVIIAVAGMEGALPSVIGGLVSRPVIAVPTSVGYGASFDGISALLGMLNSCASGVTVVNIDNGFGAAYVASLINREDK